MNNEVDTAKEFGTLYHPKSALVFYESKALSKEVYVEHFDMDRNGMPINAHPLTVREAQALAKALTTEKQKQTAFLNSNGILPAAVLHINRQSDKGAVIWHTKSQKRPLHFIEGLGIPSGQAFVPAMLWQADKNSLRVFALAGDRRPTEKTPLYFAPFFNIYEDGRVCMGSVNIDIKNSACVEEFTKSWEDYFFNSYFSHLMGGNNPVKGSCVSLWMDLVSSGRTFPKEILKKTAETLKNLLP
ncbi:PRTRC system protein B [Flavobacterium procerum]|uniref:PRTRC system protein B n=1 Tax=Flavobacterium procerum TaxID=1455569 RepID=A0ABV6BQV4_9FLAO